MPPTLGACTFHCPTCLIRPHWGPPTPVDIQWVFSKNPMERSGFHWSPVKTLPIPAHSNWTPVYSSPCQKSLPPCHWTFVDMPVHYGHCCCTIVLDWQWTWALLVPAFSSMNLVQECLNLFHLRSTWCHVFLIQYAQLSLQT